MSSASPVERLVTAFVDYAKATLPGLITKANIGQSLSAPAFKKIEKTVRMDAQYYPSVGINLDGSEFSDSGIGSLRADCAVDVFAFATNSKPEQLSTILDRYLDAIVDLASGEARAGALGFEVSVKSGDKGIEPDGTRGWVAVLFNVWGEAPF
jgi:hypothetical protein